jgi:glycosyltransferase involved in cell wall biosynthesis
MNGPSVSIVIPTRDKLPRLRLTLAALLDHIVASTTEIVVVNDGSTDGTADYLASISDDIRQVRLPGCGRSTARNAGARAAAGEYLIFLDDDMLTSSGFVQAHTTMLAAYGPKAITRGTIRTLSEVKFFVDPLHGTLYGELAQGRQRTLPALCNLGWQEDRIAESVSRLAERSRLSSHEQLSHKCMHDASAQDCRWVVVAGANLGLWKSTWEGIGGFDPAFDPYWGGEDLELGIRLCQGGYTVHHIPEACGIHLQHYRPDGEVQLRAALHLIEEKHPRVMAPWVLDALLSTFPCAQNRQPRLRS